jgi:hypothetical protein
VSTPLDAASDYVKALVLAKAAWRKSRAQLSFAEKIEILDELRASALIFRPHRNLTNKSTI